MTIRNRLTKLESRSPTKVSWPTSLIISVLESASDPKVSSKPIMAFVLGAKADQPSVRLVPEDDEDATAFADRVEAVRFSIHGPEAFNISEDKQ